MRLGRKRLAILAVAAIVVVPVSVLAWNAAGTQERPRWSVGDAWGFTLMGAAYQETHTDSVRERIDNSSSGGSIAPFHLEITYDTHSNGSQIASEQFYVSEDFGVIRIDRPVPPYEIIYGSPMAPWPFPLTVGLTWSGTVVTTYVWSEDGLDRQTVNVPYEYVVVGDGLVSVPAGIFRAIAISGDFLGLWRGKVVTHYSDAVGYIVRSDLLDESGTVVSHFDLTSYRYQAGAPFRTGTVAAIAVDSGVAAVAVWLIWRIGKSDKATRKREDDTKPADESKP